MSSTIIRRNAITAGLVVMTGILAGSAAAQTKIKPGFNLFSVDQDQEIGRQSAAEAERQLPILDDRSTTQYIDALGRRLAAVAPGAKYDYQFKIVNSSDINAFALPGGYMYLNRGLIEAARTEGELAGVMAHEMAHVALRHGTNQASKAYLGQTGLGLLGGFVDKPSTAQTISQVGGFGLNTLFLKFSRTDEKNADIVGAQILARAGYNPMDMVSFFQALEATEDRDPGKVATFFSSHPQLSDRAVRVQAEVKRLTVRVTPVVGGFVNVRTELRAMSPAPTMEEIAQGYTTPQGTTNNGSADGSVPELRIAAPSGNYREFEQRGKFFQIQHPENWRTYEAAGGYGVTIAPDGGYVRTSAGRNDLVYGVIINHYDPIDGGSAQGIFQSQSGNALRTTSRSRDGFVDNDGPIANRTTLARATDDLTRQLLRLNPSMRMVQDSTRTGSSEGEPVLSVVMAGLSPVSRQEERITLVTRELPDDHIVYAVFVVPAQEYEAVRGTFNRMMSSLRVNTAAHD